MPTTTDTRTITIVDIPLLRRLTGSGTVLDSEMGLTRDARGQHSLLLSSLLFPRGIYTLVARSEDQPVVGQFRHRPDDPIAHIVYLAPALDERTEDTVWLHILDAMAREAGKRGAQSLVAEVETSSALFETLRTARFATYARQIIWRHDPLTLNTADIPLRLTEASDSDQLGVSALLTNVLPTMLHQVAAPHSDMEGLVYRKEGRVEAYFGVSTGPRGVYLLPYLHPDVMSEAADILAAAIAQISRTEKVPVYVCVRSYQYWLHDVLHALNFEEWVEQAVMVKQIAAGIRHPAFPQVKLNGKVEVTSATPYYRSVTAKTCTYHEESE